MKLIFSSLPGRARRPPAASTLQLFAGMQTATIEEKIILYPTVSVASRNLHRPGAYSYATVLQPCKNLSSPTSAPFRIRFTTCCFNRL
jgi:hypothetical protein